MPDRLASKKIARQARLNLTGDFLAAMPRHGKRATIPAAAGTA